MNSGSLRTLQFQIHGLGLLIECARKAPKQYPERAVRMKKGVLLSIAGEFMPDNPPPYRILSPEEWINFTQDKFTNLADIDKFRKDNKRNNQNQLLDFNNPNIKAKTEEITTALASGIASQSKENILDWIKDTFGSGLDSVVQSVQGFLEGINKVIISAITPPMRAYDNLVGELDKAIQNNSQYQFVKGLVDGVVDRYHATLEQLNHLDNQTAIIQQIGKITAAAIPVALTIAAAAVPVITTEIFFPPTALGGVVYEGAWALKFMAQLHFGNTLAKLDREARGVTEEDLQKLPAWRKFAAFLRELAIASLAGGVLNVGCQLAQIQLRVLPKVNQEIVKYLETVPEEITAKNQAAAAKLRALADDVAARPMPEKIAKHIEQETQKREKKVLALLGSTEKSKQLMKVADDNVARIINEADLYVRIHTDTLNKVISRGKFTNVFENFEEGFASGISTQNPNLRKSLKAPPKKRFLTEESLFGIEQSAKGSERPIYGYLSRGGQNLSDNEGRMLSPYGDIALKLKQEVKTRSTITPDDSTAIVMKFPGMASGKYTSPKTISFISNEFLLSPTLAKPIVVTEGLKAVAEAKNIDELMQVTGKFWGRTRWDNFKELLPSDIEDISDIYEVMKAKGIKHGTPEYEQEMKVQLRRLAKLFKSRYKTDYMEFHAHGGVSPEDIEEIFMEEISHGDLQKKLKVVKDLNAGLEVKDKPPQDFIDMVNWANAMGVKITGKKSNIEIPVTVQ